MTPLRYPVGPWALFGTVVDYGSLLWQFSRREISGRYRGSVIGFGWVAFVGCVMHAVVDEVTRGLSLAGLHDMDLAFWATIDQRVAGDRPKRSRARRTRPLGLGRDRPWPAAGGV